MADFFEIDFLDVESNKSGDAICVRYEIAGRTYIHVVDGGYQSTGNKVVEHIREHYGNPAFIDHIVATHNDGDHSGGLRTVLNEFQVGALWMLRPWLYAPELIDRFSRYTNVDNLAKELRETYSNLAALEEIALERGIPILTPFQGATIGSFHVLAPTKQRFLDLVVDSERTPDAAKSSLDSFNDFVVRALREAAGYMKAAWGEEYFPEDETSIENEMSVVQYARLCDQKVLLTADAGRGGLAEAISYAPIAGLTLPGIDRFQVPHHGGRRNVSTELLDALLGPNQPIEPSPPNSQPLLVRPRRIRIIPENLSSGL
jgi:hypothetical protein